MTVYIVIGNDTKIVVAMVGVAAMVAMSRTTWYMMNRRGDDV